MSTSVRWNSWGGVGHFAASCKRELKDHGIRVPTTYLFQPEAIRALQMCDPYELLMMCILSEMSDIICSCLLYTSDAADE